MTQAQTQILHGLMFRSTTRLPGALPTKSDPDFDVRIERAGVASSELSGECVAYLARPGSGYRACLDGEQLSVRFDKTAWIQADLGSRSIAATPIPGREAITPLLLAGIVPALLLGLNGVAVLHAAAVSVAGKTIALAGPSGAGKSTAATLLCGAGGRLLADDTLRVEEAPGGYLAFAGSQQLRLRGHARELADRFAQPGSQAADGRTVAYPEGAGASARQLDVVAFPRWPKELQEPRARRVAQRQATELLLGSQRVAGWQAPQPLRANFEACTGIAQRVACVQLDLPRERLLEPGLAEQTLDAITRAVGPG